jgi:predicted RNA-binding protein Jag
MKFKQFLVSKGITEDAFKTMEAGEQAKLHSEFLDTLESVSKTEFEEMKKTIADLPKDNVAKTVTDELQKKLDELALEVKELETKGETTKGKSFLETVKENRANIDGSTKEKGTGKEFEFVVKADTLRANVVGNPNALDLGTNGLLATRKLTVYDLFQKVPVGKDRNGVIRYVDWDSATIARAAAAIAEGGTFPESTAKWATYTLGLQKVGVTNPVSEEFTYDDAMFVAEVEAFLRNDVEIKIDTDLINANGTAPNIKGLVAQSTAYTAAASGIVDASIYDLIVDVKRSITVGGGSKFNPDFALMNITDINKMLLKKDVNHQYVAPPFSQNGASGTAEFVVAGVRVIECNAVTANTMIVGCSGYAKIYEEPGFYVATGYDGSDWSSDMMTLKARKRLNLLVRTQDQVGFAKVASISAALTTLAT